MQKNASVFERVFAFWMMMRMFAGMKLSVESLRRAAWGRSVRPMLERLAFACHLALLVGACSLTGLGLIFAVFMGEVRPLCIGLAGSALSRLVHQHGYRAWNFRRWEESLQPLEFGRGFLVDEGRAQRVRELERLLHELRALDESDADRDVWAVQDLRQKVSALLAKDPGLRKECAGELTRHPDLG
jgi:hypothetical protein